ncbi:MAG: glycosyltransferase [Deferrisomatales bacterium]|nr:glycosyltransferase [Deferrisomatales bacterium]
MKILSFSYCYPNRTSPTWGVFVHQRLSSLAARTRLEVCSPVPWFPLLTARGGDPGPAEDELDGLRVHRPRFFYIPRFFKNQDARLYARGLRGWFRQVLRTGKPDLLDAHFVWPDGVGVARLAREAGIPYIITLRGKLYECLKVKSQTLQCSEALRGAAAVISVSGPMAEEARKLGVAEDRLHVIPNGIDPTVFQPRDKASCRRELGLPEGGRLLVTVAHLGHRKGHHEVLRALAGLPDDVRLVIVGGAAQGGTAEELRGVAAAAGVGERLLLPGRQPFEKIPLYYAAADASVLASYREGCPNAVLESLACGTPVVASDVGAVRDILPEPGAGRIVPPQTVEPLREALREVLDRDWDPQAVVRASGVKSWDQVADEVHGVLNGVASRKAGS